MLGPLEARFAGASIPLGGAKQRAVLATLLLRADQIVPLGLLVEEVWGDEPPQSAEHSLEVYVSRLRALFNGRGPLLARRGQGYALELGAATLDAHLFGRAVDDVAHVASSGEHERASRTAAAALRMWRGPVCADVRLGPAGRATADGLEEARLRTLEVRFDAELALGHHEELVGDLRAVTAQQPYQERFVAQLMIALYRSGRHAEALEVYEQTRRRLDDELGLQPSAELQQLSARIVRQEPELQGATPRKKTPGRRSPVERRARRIAGLALVGVATAAAMALAASGSAPQPAFDLAHGRVALVLPAHPAESGFEHSIGNNRLQWTTTAFDETSAGYGLEAETLTVDEVDPSRAEIDSLVRRIEAGRFDLVLLQGDQASARLLAPHVAALAPTRFFFIDTSLAQLSLEGVPNVTATRFALEHPARMAGYASGLMKSRDLHGRRSGAISVVAGVRDAETRRVVAGFRMGVHDVLPGARVRVDYAGETDDPTPCERLANDQINAGAGIIFVVAGRCGLGAAAVARLRRTWIAGEDEYGIGEQPWVVGSMFKDWERLPRDAIAGLVAGVFPVVATSR